MPRRHDDYDDDLPPVANNSNMLLWIGLAAGGLFLAAAACCVCGVGGYLLISRDITGTTWRGSENLAGFGPLTFQFHKKGQATMRDARGVVNGTWVKDGQNVTIRFANCEYRGIIDGKVMTGSAHGNGMLMGQVWQFTVTRD